MSEILDEKKLLFFKRNLTTVLLAFAIVGMIYMWIALEQKDKDNKELQRQLNATKDARIIDQSTINGQAQQLLDKSIEVTKYQGQLIYFLKYGRGGIYNGDNDSTVNVDQPKNK